jgi:hypothetical protein
MRQMGYFNRSTVPYRDKYAMSNQTIVRRGKLSLITKANLVRVTIEEVNSIRPSAYKYLLP